MQYVIFHYGLDDEPTLDCIVAREDSMRMLLDKAREDGDEVFCALATLEDLTSYDLRTLIGLAIARGDIILQY